MVGLWGGYGGAIAPHLRGLWWGYRPPFAGAIAPDFVHSPPTLFIRPPLRSSKQQKYVEWKFE
jgi:hypothetical protein